MGGDTRLLTTSLTVITKATSVQLRLGLWQGHWCRLALPRTSVQEAPACVEAWRQKSRHVPGHVRDEGAVSELSPDYRMMLF